MRISIIVPTCPAQREDTFSPKSGLSYRYPKDYDDDDDDYDDDTRSTRSSSDASTLSYEEEYTSRTRRSSFDSSEPGRNKFMEDEVLHENNYTKTSQKGRQPFEHLPNKAPLSSSNIYNTLVVGHTSTRTMGTFTDVDKYGVNTPVTLPMNHSEFTGVAAHQMLPDRMAPSQEDMYQRLVVGSGGVTPMHQLSSLQSPSFQSLESNFSRQVVYQAESSSTNTIWDAHQFVPANIMEEDDDEGDENQILTMIENGDMYKAWIAAPFMMAATALCLPGGGDPSRKEDPLLLQQKSLHTSNNHRVNVSPNSINKRSCAAEAIENDLYSIIETSGCNFVGSRVKSKQKYANNVEEENDDEEDEIPMSRLSADLRKQRLRNQVLSFERNTVNQENQKLREKLQQHEAEINELQLRLKELEVTQQRADDGAIERAVKIAQMMNEFLETQV